MAEYEAYKDSGFEWLGNIPVSWPIVLLSQVVTQVKNKNSDLREQNLLSLSYGRIKRKPIDTNGGLLPESFDGYNVIEANDIVLRLTDLQNDHRSLRVGLATEQGIITSAYTTMRPRNSESAKYLYYLLHTFDIRKGFYGMGSGVRQGLNYDEVKKLKLPLPTIVEQEAIAAYLDRETERIDAIITEAKASIEEYKVWKASIIYEAVTKGLNTDVELADSGIDYIGRIPKHWKLTSLKRICTRISDGSHFSPETTNEGYPYVTAGDVHGKGIDYCRCRNISEEAFDALVKAGCRPQKGEVLLVKDGATTGRVGLMTDDEPCVLLSSVAMLTPSDTVFSEYLMRLLESEVLQFQIRKSMAGSAMPRTTLTKLQSYTVIDCPYAEQVQIAKYLDVKCEMIDKLIAEKEKLLLDLEAYKKSLIFEAVTGKRKVV